MKNTGKIIIGVVVGVIILAVLAFVIMRFVLAGLSSATGTGSYDYGYAESAGFDASQSDDSRGSIRGLMADSFGGSAQKMIAPGSAPISAPVPSEPAVALPGGVERLIIKTGSLAIVVKDVNESVAKITAYAKAKGGFVVSSNIYKYGIAPRADVTIRIPVKEFDASVGEAKSLGDVESEQVNGQDVTEEYVDLDAQIRNLRATENQLMEIMKRSGTIPDVLAVQRELTEVRRDIERIQGRMKYLTQSSELSTLTVSLSTDPDALPVVEQGKDTWKPFAVLKDAVRSLLEVGKVLINFLIVFVVYIPVWFLIGLVIWVVVKIIKHFTRGKHPPTLD